MISHYSSKPALIDHYKNKTEFVKKNKWIHQAKGESIYHINEPATKINKHQAIEITRKFLEQHHNVSSANAILKKNKWFVTMCVGMSKSTQDKCK